MAAGRTSLRGFEFRHGYHAHAALDRLFFHFVPDLSVAQDNLLTLFANRLFVELLVPRNPLKSHALENDEVGIVLFGSGDHLRGIVPDPVADHPANVTRQPT